MTIYRILSLDGGGIRGAATAQFLKALEAALPRSIYQSFDYFAGTSTGGLIALLAVNQASTDDCVTLYNADNGGQIMDKSVWDRMVPIYLQTAPKYDGKGKTKVLKRVFKQQRLRSASKPVLITAYDINQRQIVVFKSDGGSESEYNPPVWEVADATSAAPTYFPTVKSSAEPSKWLVDGGVAANNPSMCALAEAIKKGVPLADIRMVAVGTGIPCRGSDDANQTGEASRNWGGVEWLKHGLIDHLFAGSMGAVDYWCKQILGENFIRVNGPLTYARDDIDDVSEGNIFNLRRMGDEWFKLYGKQVSALIAD